MKKLSLLFSFLFVSGWSCAEPLKQVFNPFTGKPDYITRIDSNTVIGGTNCTSTSNANGTVTITCAGGGGGISGSINTAAQYSDAYYSVAGTSNVISGLAPGTSSYVLTSGGSSAPPFWSIASSSASPGGSSTDVQYNLSGSFAGSPTFTTDASSVTASTMVAGNFVATGPIDAEGGIVMGASFLTNNGALDWWTSPSPTAALYDRLLMTNSNLGSGPNQQRYKSGWNFEDASGNVKAYISAVSSTGGNLTLNTTGQIQLYDGPTAKSVIIVSSNTNTANQTIVLPGSPATSTNSFVNVADIQGGRLDIQYFDLYDSSPVWTGQNVFTSTAGIHSTSLTSQCANWDANGNLNGSGSACGISISSAIFNQSTLQAGATAYPSFAVIGSSSVTQGTGLFGPPFTALDFSSDSSNATSGAAFFLNVSSSPVPSSATVYGLESFVQGFGSSVNNRLSALNGSLSESLNSGRGYLPLESGAVDFAFNSSTGTVNFSEGVRTGSQSNGGGIINNGIGVYVQNGVISSTMTNSYGAYIDATKFGVSSSSTTNNYGIYIASQTLNTVNSYGVYSNLNNDVFTGTATVGNLTLSNVASGTQCLHANSSGQVTGTGSDCGSGGSGPNGSINTASQYSSAYYSVTGTSNVISGLAPGTSSYVLTSAGSSAAPFWTPQTGGGGGGSGIVSPGTFTWVNNYGMSLSTVTISSNTVLPGATFYQGGPEVFTGNVGVGVVPAYTLNVKGTSVFSNDGTTGETPGIIDIFKNGASAGDRLLTVGTSNLLTQFYIEDQTAPLFHYGAQTADLVISPFSNQDIIYSEQQSFNRLDLGYGSNVQLESGGGNSVLLSPSGTEALRASASGNIGIGASNPGQRLQLSSGTFKIDGNVSPAMIINGAGAPPDTYALCLSGGALGHCTSIIGAGGSCTCSVP